MLRKFVELRPADANAYDSLGEVQLLAGQFGDAEASFQKAASMLPDMFMAWAGVAYARALRGDLAGAREVAAKGRAFAKGPQDRFVLDLVAIWSSLASGNAAAAFQRLDEVEAEAQKQKNDLQYVLCALERSRLEAETGRTPAAREHAALSLARAEKARLSGNDQNRIRRAALLVEAVSSARAGMQAQAARALSALEGDLKDAPSNADLRGAVHYARGAIALSQGNAAAAKESLERCSDTDYFCKLALAKAQEAAGDPALASETRAKLLRANARDNLHRGEAPVYLYVHTQLAGTGGAGQK
jgi:ATP/maltotriose-dependent transcriptional regulator MalT